MARRAPALDDARDTTSRSWTNEAGDGGRCLRQLLVGLGAPCIHGVNDTVREVVVEQLDGDGLERLRDRGDLVEDLDAVLVLVDHALQSTDLAFDAAQALLDG